MDWNRRHGRIAAAVVLLAASGLLFPGLSSFGIWDPWELGSADLARQLASGEAGTIERPPLANELVARGFAAFGVHEWSGRLPVALAGLLTVALAYLLVARFAGRRAGAWAALVTATTPLFLTNARQMLGVAPALAASAAVFLCASAAVFAPAGLRAPEPRRRLSTGAWLVGLAISVALATRASGVLQGVAPPLLGAAVAVVAKNELRPSWRDPRRTIAAAVVLAAAAIAAGGAAYAVWADYAGFGWWTGGVARGGNPPTWEVAIERLFHSFAPWSALLPLALGRMLIGHPRAAASIERRIGGPRAALTIDHPEENALRLGLVAWVAFGYLAETLFTARYGAATFLPVVGAAAAVALLLRAVERSPRAWWGTGIIGFLFVGLIIRDFGEYPGSPVEGLVAEGLEVPDVFNPAKHWALGFGVFALLLVLGLAADPARARASGQWSVRSLVHELAAPARLIRAQWARGGAFKAWIGALALLLLALLGFGVFSLAVPELLLTNPNITTLHVRIGGYVLALLLPGIVLVIAGGRFALWLFGRLGSYRLVPALVAGLGLGAYVSFGFLPALSSHFSPREVYDAYEDLASEGEPLGEFRVGGRAAAYYATGELVELESQAALIDFLRQDRRVWVSFRADDLAAIDREYRQRTEQHLFVADAHSARMILATNRPLPGMRNHNYLADAILDEPPSPQHPVAINFDNRVELLGIDLDLPHGSYVGPGEAFRITWYFRVNAPVPGGYQPFVHIDGPGERINGDHEPVEGHYPVRLWEPGDIIVDRQELRVPANYRRGDLTIYMGFYSGEQRLEIVSGPEDDVNRARVGIIPVR